MNQCTARWVLNLDADEVASPDLVRELRTVAAADRIGGLKIPRREYQFGRWQSDMTRKNALIRFFRRDLARYGDHAVHEQVFVDGAVVRARGVIFHYGESTIADKVEKINAYSTLAAGDKKKRRGSRIKMLVALPFAFFRSYILRRTCLDGWRGVAHAVLNGVYAFLKEAKRLELSDTPENDEPPKQ